MPLRRPSRWLLPFLATAVVLASPALCEDTPDKKDTFSASAEVSSILVPVTVRDSKGRLVSNLEKDRFHLIVDDMEFPIRSFWREGGLPISYTFVVDTSGSMNGRRLAKTRDAVCERTTRCA
jgi:Mg-chelatase subunit ChlD